MQDFMANYSTCQLNKYQALTLTGLLQPLSIPHKVWEDVSKDFIVRLPKSSQFDTIMVVVNQLTKYNHFVPLSHFLQQRMLQLLL